MDVLKNKENANLIILLGGFYKIGGSNNFPISKKVLWITEIIRNTCIGEEKNNLNLEIANF